MIGPAAQNRIVAAIGVAVVVIFTVSLAEDVHALAVRMNGSHQCDDSSCWKTETVVRSVRDVRSGRERDLWFCPEHGPSYFGSEDDFQHIGHRPFWVRLAFGSLVFAGALVILWDKITKGRTSPGGVHENL